MTLFSRSGGTVHELTGLEPDNLLAFLALVGALRAIEHEAPTWAPRISFAGPPWRARLHIDREVGPAEIAKTIATACESIAAQFDVEGRSDVKLTPDEFHAYAQKARRAPIPGALAAALAAEHPPRPSGNVATAPLVMMFGQGHQHFVDRLIAVPRGELPNRFKKLKKKPDMKTPAKIAEALFEPWRRADDADAFRWDPEEDQRYALRFDDPSSAGAALTVHGANRMAAIGFLSFPCAPRKDPPSVPAVCRDEDGTHFVWPLWRAPLSRAGIEVLLTHPAVIGGRLDLVRPLGVCEIYRATRVVNDKFVNVARARPWRGH